MKKELVFFLALAAAFTADERPNASGYGCTYERGNDEYPEVRQGLAAFEESGADGAGGIHAGAGVVDTHEVDENEGETDGQTGKVVGGTVGLRGGAEHYEHEDECQEAFNDETVQLAGSAGVGAGGGTLGQTRRGGYEQIEGGSGEDGADDLAYDVTASVLTAHAAAEEHAEGDGGIDVASADAADGIGHGYYGKTEGYGCTYYGSRVGTAIQTNGCTATEEREHECAYQFC